MVSGAVSSTGFRNHQQRRIGINLDQSWTRTVLGAERLQLAANHVNTLGGFDAQRNAMAGNTLYNQRDVLANHDPLSNFPA
jgi:hypothetical protein